MTISSLFDRIMNYNKTQKFTSFLLIFLLLFGITFQFSSLQFWVSASSNNIYDLVSIIIDEETYKEVESEIKRYSKDISNVLENTKVVVLLIPENTSPFKIASMNEALYFDWYKALSWAWFESKLVWTVLVWNISMPVVFRANELSRTILPYTDFKDKSYIYNIESWQYEYNSENTSWIEAEIWHWVIFPNTWNKKDDINAIKEYFAKNHDFYTWAWFYSKESKSMNANRKEELVANYEPYVFYYDGLRESSAVNYAEYIWYNEWYLANKEDIVYKRYTTELADKLKNEILGYSTNEIYDLIKKVDPNYEIPSEESLILDNAPDIQSRHVINASIKKFIEIFSSWAMWELRENVYNAGRYNFDQNVNVDFIPYLISVLDIANDEILKDLNTDLENQIDKLVQNWLSRKIALPVSYTFSGSTVNTKHVNYLFWNNAWQINNPLECSIYRWTTENWWQLVEANRWFNILNMESDLKIVEWMWVSCLQNVMNGASLEWLWWKNSPINFDEKLSDTGEIVFKYANDLKWSIVNLYDIQWAKKIDDSSKILSPLACYDNNYILASSRNYRLPNLNWWSWIWWSCMTDSNRQIYEFPSSFDENYVNFQTEKCRKKSIILDWVVVKEKNYKEKCYRTPDWEVYCECTTPNIRETLKWEYKSIASDIEHKSPTAEDIWAQIASWVTPNLPIDKDRYIDFITREWKYAKIDYPYLFRVQLEDKRNISFDIISEELDKYLNKKSEEINSIFSNSSEVKWLLNNEEVNALLATKPSWKLEIDLKSYIKWRWSDWINLNWANKDLDYYDILLFSIFWNNLDSVSAKYKFVFENYLSSQNSTNNKYYLPKNKSQYEIAYLWAHWDAQNMFIWVDPENKWENPYANIISLNQDLSTKLLWVNIASNKYWDKNKKKDKCWSPEWVPIWEWLPAIMCRLQEMMPPTITIWDWNCWESFLELFSDEEKEKFFENNWDYDNNWINDYLEMSLKEADLVLSTDSLKHFHNSVIPLKASLKWPEWAKMPFINSTDISFEITKLEKVINEEKSREKIELVYDKNNNKWTWKNFVNFEETSIRTIWWVSSYSIWAKAEDLNVYLKASVKVNNKDGEEVVYLQSNILKLEIRWDRLFVSTNKIENTDSWTEVLVWSSSVLADEWINTFIINSYESDVNTLKNLLNNASNSKEKLIFNVDNLDKEWKKISLNFPLKLELYSSDNLIEEKEIYGINNFEQLFAITKAGEYILAITDSQWVRNTKEFTVKPSEARRIDLNLWTNIIQAGSNISTNYVTILDRFDNVVSWEFNDLNFSINWKSVVFNDSDSSELTATTFEGYRIFRLKSTWNSWISEVKVSLLDEDKKELVSATKNVNVIDSHSINFLTMSDFYVWNNEYKIRVDIKDSAWNLLKDFNSRLYFNVNSNYLDLERDYFDVRNGSAMVEFTTKTMAWKDIPVEIQVEWLWTILSNSITILPDKAIKMDLINSKSRMEASSKEFSLLQVELKDKYNNLVFNDSETKVSLEILDKYKHIIDTKSNSETFYEWKASFRIYWTDNPWTAYFKVKATWDIDKNNIIIEDDSWKVEISWVGENAGKIETYYLWNKNKLDNMQFNSIYTTLLWANYWDIEQENYLAWSLVFNKNSKALVASSTLSDPYLYNNTLALSSNWWVLKLFSSWDLSQDIQINTFLNAWKLYLDIFNSSLNSHIWSIHYNLPKNPELRICDWNISDCLSDNTSVFVKTLDWKFKFINRGANVLLVDNSWKSYLEIDSNWNLSKKSNIDFELVSSNAQYLLFNLRYQDKVVWQLWMNFIDAKNTITRDELVLSNTLRTVSNSIITYIDSALYWYYINGKDKEQRIIIYYNDPFWSDKSLNSFTRGNNYWYETFATNAWLWWNDWNKTLLEFAAWESVWVALKNNMSFSSINIWDPVISLKQQRKKFNNTEDFKQFDSTIGKVINNDEDLKDFRVFDYNNDWLDDILLIKNSWYLQLLENWNSKEWFLNLWDLAYVIDMWNLDMLKTWDFTWDWYADIFFLWKDWRPYLLNNIEKQFTKISLTNILNLDWAIVKAEVFDMDNDWIDDIVILDDNWNISIFYWNSDVSDNIPSFTRLPIDKWYWIKMSWDAVRWWALLYFDWLFQLWENNKIVDKNSEVDYNFLNNYLFEKLTYSTEEEHDLKDVNDLEEMPDFLKETTFIKSEYAETIWLEVEKIFKDRNWWNIKNEDIIDVEIKIKNTSWNTLNNLVYVDKVPSYIKFSKSSISANIDNIKIKNPWSTYDFLVDSFSLKSNEEITIKYFWAIKTLRYTDIRVWLFEEWEEGDDKYWDIIVSLSDKNCAEELDIFRSIWIRDYEKWTKSPKCENVELPENLKQNIFDADWNWIPDYIEQMTSDEDLKSEYVENALENLYRDTDNDWIPDDEDDFSMDWSFTLDLWKFTEEVEAWLDKIDDFMDSLSCWFNNWACFSSPLNWAPLAPWSDPTIMWKLAWDWLKIDEWMPIFSAITWLQTYCWVSPCCLPTVYPVSPLSYVPWPTCWPPWAWWRLWIWSKANFVRIFVTPTLTGWVWTAICFGWPAWLKWMSNPPWAHPIIPGWNCIVLAQPILWCNNDGSDWDPSSLWIPDYWTWTKKFGIINWNCPIVEVETPSSSLNLDYVRDYYEHITWKKSWLNLWSSNWAVEDHSTWRGEPSFVFDTNYWWTEVSVKWDNENKTLDFSDIEKISQKRIYAFPSYLMGWVTRQVEEIANKLTKFPSFFLILPSFDWIYDTDLSWSENRDKWKKGSSYDTNDPINFNSKKEWWYLDWAGFVDTIKDGYNTVKSSVKDAYEFIATLPFVNVRQEPIWISIPWISKTEIDRTLESRKMTITEERPEELRRITNEWSLWTTCELTNSWTLAWWRSESIEECEERNAAWERIMLQANSLISSMNSNLEAIKSYADIPEKINKLLNKKEEYLEQILCNIDSISEIMGGRIWRNGDRFKSWVELFILTKAILKSWQLIVDIFYEYEEWCKECKNERHDLLWSIFELVSFTIPQIPVIEFPKWPDVVLDLHNIRWGLNIDLPEFDITPRPILLPELPSLSLPSVPTANLSLPSIPVLPELIIPELPDIPSLPSIDLPDLPPAPSLPKLLSNLEIILDIARLVTKAMCILKKSPFVPEWRAGDQIAFLTERNWFLPTDFLDLSLPEFSFPFVDAIKISSYVNLEFDTQFITEMAWQIAAPINKFNSDFSNLFDISLNNLDFSSSVPNDINLDVKDDWWIDTNIQAYSYENNINVFAEGINKYLLEKVAYIDENKTETVDSERFKREIWEYLASVDISANPEYVEIINLWNSVNSYSYSEENKLIKDLKQNNEEKFSLVKDIINTEIVKNKKLKEDFNISLEEWTRKVSIWGNSNIDEYNDKLDKYNIKIIDSIEKLKNNNEEEYVYSDLKLLWDELKVKSEWLSLMYSENDSDLLAVSNHLNFSGSTVTDRCVNSNWDYRYNYDGLYIIEWDKSYKLFDYKKELTWDEKMKITDFDLDWDDDILYLMNGVLYLKENLSWANERVYLNEEPNVIASRNNKFLNNNFIESVNNFRSRISLDWIINTSFTPLIEINNYRLTYNKVIDKLYNEQNDWYRPIKSKKDIIDWVIWIGIVNINKEEDLYNELNNIVYIDNIWNLKDVEIEYDELKDIRNDISNWNIVSLSRGTNLYSWNASATIRYTSSWNSEVKIIILPKNKYIEIKSPINIVWITGEAYVNSWEKAVLKWWEIKELIWKPLFPWTKIYYNWDNENQESNSYLSLRYYDSSALSINFNDVSSWSFTDLWMLWRSAYTFNAKADNDFYYARINWFRTNTLSTSSNQELLSPQNKLWFLDDIDVSGLRLPIYQKQSFNLLDYIELKDSESNIKDIYVDFDLAIDSNMDWNPRNDNDSIVREDIKIEKIDNIINILLGEFEELFNKNIAINLEREDWTKEIYEIRLEVYSPFPEIIDFNDTWFVWNIDESLSWEPINIFRIRWWVITKLEDINWEDKVMTDSWNYDFSIPKTLWWVQIEKNNEIIAQVDEQTWKIFIRNSDYKLRVIASNHRENDSDFPKIILWNSRGDIYYQSLKIVGNKEIKVVASLDEAVRWKDWLYVKLHNNSNYKYSTIPMNVSENGWSLIIYRVWESEKEELFVIFKDWKINSQNDNYTLEYDSFDNYVVISLIDKLFKRKVAEILYKVNSDFVVQ